MRILSREEADRHFGDPNFYHDSPPYLLEKGDVGYVPSDFVPAPPSPHPRPPLQPPEPYISPWPSAAATALHTIPDHANPYVPTMTPLQYLIIPNRSSTRPFRARVKLGAQVDQDELLAAVAANAGVDRATVELVLRSLFRVMISFLRQSRAIGSVLGLFRAFPSITGSFPTNDPSADEVKRGVEFTLAPGPDADALMRGDLDVERVGEQGTVKPVIDSIALHPGGQVEVYSTTVALRISGQHFRENGANAAWATVTLLDSAMGNPTPITLTECTETEITLVPMPGGTTGTRYVKITAAWDPTLFAISGPLTLHT